MAAARLSSVAARGAAAVTAAGLGGTAALYLGDREAFDTAGRLRRTASLASRMLLDYSWHLRGQEPGSPAREEALAACHRRNAPLLRDLCFRNGGVYIKIGQLLGLMDYILPVEYLDALASCYDACPCSSAGDVEAVLLEDLGHLPQQTFEAFDFEPIASASLAQVHRAKLHGGQEVAVKVQHRPLRRMVRTEIGGIDIVLRCVRWVEPAFGFEWVVEEVRENLPKELDFRLEAQNAARTRKMLDAAGFAGAVVVPRTHETLTTARVLVMDFEHGRSLGSTAEAMRAEGVEPYSVVRRYSEAYAEMTFAEGFLHCDPHPGNVLWRRCRAAPGGFQLVLLDHGLYRELPRKLRLAYCHLWYAIALGDGEATLRATRALGVRSEWLVEKLASEGIDGTGRLAAAAGQRGTADDAEALAGKMLAAMLTARSYRAVADGRGGLLRFDRSHRGQSAEQDRAEVGGYIAGYLRGILDVLDTLPRSMILVLKANDCLRATASRFDVPPSVPLAASCRACRRALRLAGDPAAGGWRGWLLEVRCWLYLALGEAISGRLQCLRRAVAGA